ncbi:MAG: tetratricopeptide repeat protein, partial [Phycisphaerales bacterium]|nr:tetratricopeptide repeat protein [Phycisphaerales bacterium]
HPAAADVTRLAPRLLAVRVNDQRFQLSKFAKRNKVLVGGVLGIILALTVGLVSTLVMYQRALTARELAATEAARATREASRANAIKDYLLVDMIQAASPDRDGYEVRVTDVLKRAADRVGDRFGTEPDLETEVRSLLGNTFRLLGMRADAIAQQKQRIAVIQRQSPPDAVALAMAYADLASALMLDDQPKDAEEAARKALDLYASGGGSEMNRLAAQVALGAALQAQGRYAEAEPIVRDVLARQERIRGPSARATLITFSILISTVQSQNRTDEALQLSREFVRRCRESDENDRQSTIVAVNNLATALQNAGKFEEAWEYARTLPEDAEKLFPEGHPFRLVALINAGSAARRVNRIDDAVGFLSAAVDVATKTYGPGDYQTERAIGRLRDVYRVTNNIDKAIEWGRLNVRTRLMVAGPGEWESVVKSMSEFEAYSRKHDRASDADIVAWLIATAEDAAPPGSRSRARYLGNLGMALVVFNRPDDAEPLLKRAEQSLSSPGIAERDERDNLAIIYNALAKLAEIQGKVEESKFYRAKVPQ